MSENVQKENSTEKIQLVCHAKWDSICMINKFLQEVVKPAIMTLKLATVKILHLLNLDIGDKILRPQTIFSASTKKLVQVEMRMQPLGDVLRAMETSCVQIVLIDISGQVLSYVKSVHHYTSISLLAFSQLLLSFQPQYCQSTQ